MITINIYMLISIMAMTLEDGTVTGFCMDAIFPCKAKAPRQWWIRILFWTIYLFLVSGSKVIFADTLGLTGNAIVGFIGCIGVGMLLMFWFYAGSFLRTCAMYLLLLMMAPSGEFTFDLLYLFIRGEMFGVQKPVDYGTAETAIACLCASAMGIFYQLLLTAFIRSRKKPGTESYMPFLLMLLPALGIMVLGLFMDTGNIGITYVLCSFVYILFFCCIYFILGKAEKRRTDRELAAFEQEMARERLHYTAMKARREEMAKLRHDYRNVLTTVLLLLEEGNQASARQMVEDLLLRMDNTRDD